MSMVVYRMVLRYVDGCLELMFFVECCGDHRDLHVPTHSFPTRRSSDLLGGPQIPGGQQRRPRLHLSRSRDASGNPQRSEEHTSELQSLMRNSYAVFC